MTPIPREAVSVLEVRMEVRIDGPPAKVWQALTDDIGAWWPDAFFAGGEAGKREYHLEARPGGQMYESWEGGGGLLWGTVVTVDPARRLQITGTTFPDFGGPSVWFGSFQLEAVGSSTLLQFSESTLGRISDEGADQKKQGWEFLFGRALKAHVEGRPAPAWED